MPIPVSGIMSKAEFVKWWYANHYLEGSENLTSLSNEDWHKYHITLLDMAYACYRQGIGDYRESAYKVLMREIHNA